MNKVLVIIDMQNDFIDGVLGSKEAKNVVPKVIEKLDKHDGTVVFTRDTHGPDYMHTQEGKNLPVKHCIEDTWGWSINEDIIQAAYRNFDEPKKFDITIVDKGSFGYGHWDGIIEDDPDEIELVGVCTDICVISNAMILKAIYPEVPIIVDAACCAGVTPEAHKVALDAMKACQIKVINED